MSFLFKKLLLRNRAADFVEIGSVWARKAIIKHVERKINSDKICRSYIDLNFGVTFLEHSVYIYTEAPEAFQKWGAQIPAQSPLFRGAPSPRAL